jgi:dGTPase
LEVAQLGRSIARALGLNEDLVEAVALAHDLGHTPFGHAGQDALNECMQAYGGFEHNLQSLRVVDHLEERYPEFDGLNLSFETREGILKHCAKRNALLIEAQEPGGVAHRFLKGTQPSLEAQLCNLADAIAYNAHDIDDGVRSGLLTLSQMDEVPLFAHYKTITLQQHPGLADANKARRLLYETIRRMLSDQVYDVIDTTRQHLTQHLPQSADEARLLGPLVAFSEPMAQQVKAMKSFLFKHLYRHPQVMETTTHAQRVVRELFDAYLSSPQEMSPDFSAREETPRAVADYIAGMTDRYAAREHERLTGRRLLA